ncbi:MAG: helix-turn-helix domain-containing protein [Clostridia bacterium]|nr:helix-turn-helix domain-containing protein [Clostridia bacterium]MBQ6529904.1 helix-turn-helix domain-containing protein [Clostridia bacterium]
MKGTAFSPHEDIYIQHLKTGKKNDMPVQHYHDAYEIYLQLDGKRYFFYDNICHVLEHGDMIILRPFDIHYAESRECEYYERYVLNFKSQALNSILTKEEAYILLEKKLKPGIIRLGDRETEELLEYFKKAEAYSKLHGFLADKLICSAVLQLIVKAVGYIKEDYLQDGERVPEKIIDALDYMNKHYKEEISIDDISAAANMSKHYFCRLFKRTTGATALGYLHNIRLTRVHNLLLNTTMPLDEIAWETGFGTTATLARVFKAAYGVPPREFRKSGKESR